jgi:FkbM family methyltransferase
MNALGARGHLVLARTPHGDFLVDPADRAVGTELLWGSGVWQRQTLLQAIEVLRAAGALGGPVFVELGANIGTETVYALQAGFARAVAFEPEPGNAELLARNLVLNGVADRAHVVRKAAGAVRGTATLHLHPRNKGNHTIGRPAARDGIDAIPIDVVPTGEALRDLGIAAEEVGLVWVDTEGFEPQAVAGLGELLARGVPIVLEYSPDRYAAADREALVQALAAHYSTMLVLGRDAAVPGPVDGIRALTRGHTDVLLWRGARRLP